MNDTLADRLDYAAAMLGVVGWYISWGNAMDAANRAAHRNRRLRVYRNPYGFWSIGAAR